MAEAMPLCPMTLEEYYALPESDALRHELQAGLLISEPVPGFRHGSVSAAITALLRQHVNEHELGVVTGEAAFLLARSPATIRGPDAAFVSKARLADIDDAVRAFPGAPDLAVEVLSPSNTPAAMHAKVADYLAAGARLVWVVDSRTRSVTEYKSLLKPRVLGPHDNLDGGDVIPGFAVRVEELFRDVVGP